MTRMDSREKMRLACVKYHRENPEVWDLFVRFTTDKIDLGYENYGAKAVMERIRWETSTGANSPELKINNNHTAFYAGRFNRLFGRKFFRTRSNRTE